MPKALFVSTIEAFIVGVSSPFFINVVWKDPVIKKATTTTMPTTSNAIAKPDKFVTLICPFCDIFVINFACIGILLFQKKHFLYINLNVNNNNHNISKWIN